MKMASQTDFRRPLLMIRFFDQKCIFANCLMNPVFQRTAGILFNESIKASTDAVTMSVLAPKP